MHLPREIITKLKLKQQGFGEAAEEYCGPASIAMLLGMAGVPTSVQVVVDKMSQSAAFIEGKGTVLSRVSECFRQFTYLPILPTWLLVGLLKMNFAVAHSIKRDKSGAGHIVCVCAYEHRMIYFFDPNRDDDTPRSVTVRQWRKLSNRRGLAIRVIQ